MLEVRMKVDMEMPDTCSQCDYEVIVGRDDGLNYKECLFTEEVLPKDNVSKCRGKKCPLVQLDESQPQQTEV
jgi:hypothetical protein